MKKVNLIVFEILIKIEKLWHYFELLTAKKKYECLYIVYTYDVVSYITVLEIQFKKTLVCAFYYSTQISKISIFAKWTKGNVKKFGGGEVRWERGWEIYLRKFAGLPRIYSFVRDHRKYNSHLNGRLNNSIFLHQVKNGNFGRLEGGLCLRWVIFWSLPNYQILLKFCLIIPS